MRACVRVCVLLFCLINIESVCIVGQGKKHDRSNELLVMSYFFVCRVIAYSVIITFLRIRHVLFWPLITKAKSTIVLRCNLEQKKRKIF